MLTLGYVTLRYVTLLRLNFIMRTNRSQQKFLLETCSVNVALEAGLKASVWCRSSSSGPVLSPDSLVFLVSLFAERSQGPTFVCTFNQRAGSGARFTPEQRRCLEFLLWPLGFPSTARPAGVSTANTPSALTGSVVNMWPCATIQWDHVGPDASWCFQLRSQ